MFTSLLLGLQQKILVFLEAFLAIDRTRHDHLPVCRVAIQWAGYSCLDWITINYFVYLTLLQFPFM